MLLKRVFSLAERGRGREIEREREIDRRRRKTSENSGGRELEALGGRARESIEGNRSVK